MSKTENQMKDFTVGIRFRPIGKAGDHKNNDEKKAAVYHWALVFAPCNDPDWCLVVELLTDPNGVLSFPTTPVRGRLHAYEFGKFSGYLDDVLHLIQVHPMRHTRYSAAFNNCQHWAATLLVLLEAFCTESPENKFNVTHRKRYNKLLKVLSRAGSRLYHRPNWLLKGAHMLGVGGGAAAVGAAAVAAEATVMTEVATVSLVQSTGIAAWFGGGWSLVPTTMSVAVPTTGAMVAMAALPLTIAATGFTAGAFVYTNIEWKKKTLFDDPRQHGVPKDGRPLSGVESGLKVSKSKNGESHVISSSASSAQSGMILLGSGSGVAVGSVFATCSPGFAAGLAPSLAVSTVGGLVWGLEKAS